MQPSGHPLSAWFNQLVETAAVTHADGGLLSLVALWEGLGRSGLCLVLVWSTVLCFHFHLQACDRVRLELSVKKKRELIFGEVRPDMSECLKMLIRSMESCRADIAKKWGGGRGGAKGGRRTLELSGRKNECYLGPGVKNCAMDPTVLHHQAFMMV